jgi:RNA polymerase sigma factor (sigma-70 family)
LATNEHIEDVIDELYGLFQKNNVADDDVLILLNKLISMSISSETSIIDLMSKDKILTDNSNTITTYFDEVGKIYNNLDLSNDIEYSHDNRDILIKSNLKTVIYIAKMYRNKGVDFEDLISAGNLGLCIAFDKFKPNDIKIRKQLIDTLDNMTDFTCVNDKQYYQSEYISEQFSKIIRYGKLNALLNDFISARSSYEYNEIINFINNQVCGARFNSVATMWIRAMILSEIKNSTLIRRPDSVRLKSKQNDGVYNPDTYISLSRTISDDGNATLEALLETPDTEYDAIDYVDRRIVIRDLLDKLMTGVSTRDRRIFLKKFGVGLPRPLQPKEIAQQEDLSIARVSQIFQQVMTTMRENARNMDIDENALINILGE